MFTSVVSSRLNDNFLITQLKMVSYSCIELSIVESEKRLCCKMLIFTESKLKFTSV